MIALMFMRFLWDSSEIALTRPSKVIVSTSGQLGQSPLKKVCLISSVFALSPQSSLVPVFAGVSKKYTCHERRADISVSTWPGGRYIFSLQSHSFSSSKTKSPSKPQDCSHSWAQQPDIWIHSEAMINTCKLLRRVPKWVISFDFWIRWHWKSFQRDSIRIMMMSNLPNLL